MGLGLLPFFQKSMVGGHQHVDPECVVHGASRHGPTCDDSQGAIVGCTSPRGYR